MELESRLDSENLKFSGPLGSRKVEKTGVCQSGAPTVQQSTPSSFCSLLLCSQSSLFFSFKLHSLLFHCCSAAPASTSPLVSGTGDCAYCKQVSLSHCSHLHRLVDSLTGYWLVTDSRPTGASILTAAHNLQV